MGNSRDDRGSGRTRLIDREEERVWSEFYRQIGDPTVAAELIGHMDQDPQVKALHSGLYLRCRQSLRLAKKRQERAKAVGRALRRIAALLAWPIRTMRRCGAFCAAVSVAFYSGSGEPAAGQLRKLGKRPLHAAKSEPADVGKRASGSEGR